MKRPFLVALVCLSLLATHARLCYAAQSGANNPAQSGEVALPPQALEIKAQVQKIGLGKHVTVILPDKREFYGSIGNIEADGFQILEVDLNQSLAFKFSEVKKVRKGYGGKGAFGKRVNPRTNLITGAVILGVLLIALPIYVGTHDR